MFYRLDQLKLHSYSDSKSVMQNSPADSVLIRELDASGKNALQAFIQLPDLKKGHQWVVNIEGKSVNFYQLLASTIDQPVRLQGPIQSQDSADDANANAGEPTIDEDLIGFYRHNSRHLCHFTSLTEARSNAHATTTAIEILSEAQQSILNGIQEVESLHKGMPQILEYGQHGIYFYATENVAQRAQRAPRTKERNQSAAVQDALKKTFDMVLYFSVDGTLHYAKNINMIRQHIQSPKNATRIKIKREAPLFQKQGHHILQRLAIKQNDLLKKEEARVAVHKRVPYLLLIKQFKNGAQFFLCGDFNVRTDAKNDITFPCLLNKEITLLNPTDAKQFLPDTFSELEALLVPKAQMQASTAQATSRLSGGSKASNAKDPALTCSTKHGI